MRRKIEFDPGLQDQFLGDPLIVIALEPSEQIALVGEEQCPLDLEPVGRDPFNADGGISAGRPRPEVLANADLQIEPRIDRARVERLNFGAFNPAPHATFAFGFDHEPVDIAAEPAFAIPAIGV